ncbi:MAG TPA: glycosyltransferase family 4 protein, partial [Burkholderiaceae bacterium]|nr:glycosyltransferase family 4 protein [Burkholderiaceae bacterium]
MSAPAAAPAVWFPAIRTGTGSDVFTIRLCEGLNARGIRSEITWLPHRAEYLPWTVAAPVPPAWATLVHLNTWVHRRFIPTGLPLVATMHLCVHDPALRPYKSLAQRLYHRFWVRPMERHLLRRVRQLVAVSHYTAARTQDCLGVPAPLVIPNGVPLSPDWADPVRFLQRPAGQPFRLLYVGNWSRRKGVDLLAPLMQALGPGFELDYTADAHGAHQGASLPAHCRCIGRLGPDALQDAYRRAD